VLCCYNSWLSLIGEGQPGNYVASGYSVHEEENEHLQEGLRAKVTALKSVSSSSFCLLAYWRLRKQTAWDHWRITHIMICRLTADHRHRNRSEVPEQNAGWYGECVMLSCIKLPTINYPQLLEGSFFLKSRSGQYLPCLTVPPNVGYRLWFDGWLAWRNHWKSEAALQRQPDQTTLLYVAFLLFCFLCPILVY
jgi:hypothetical protein